MLQLRQQRRIAAESILRGSGSALASFAPIPPPILGSPAYQENALFPVLPSDSGDSGIGSSIENSLPRRQQQQLNIVGPPERSPTLDGRSLSNSEGNNVRGEGGMLRPVGEDTIAANLQLRRISRLNHNMPSSVTLANSSLVNGRPENNTSSGGVASGIFEESVQRVTLAVDGGEEELHGGGTNNEQAANRQEEEEEEEMVETIMREMMENETRDTHRYRLSRSNKKVVQQ
jgi:hypothetical protein